MVLNYIICCLYFHDVLKTYAGVEKGKVLTKRQTGEGVIFQENISTVIIYHFKICYKHLIVYA